MPNKNLIGAVALLFTAAACSNDSTAPISADAALNADVATIAGETTAEDAEVMQAPGGAAFGMGLAFNAARWDCTRELPLRLTVDRTCVFKDAQGNVQTAYDPVTTASVNISVTIDGSIDRNHLSATIHRTHDLVVTGLAGAETQRTWNGTGSGTLSAVHERSDGSTRTYSVSSASTITNVVVPVPRTLTSWPLSGSIHRVITLTKADNSQVTRDVTITFNGTQNVTVNVNGETYDFDLTTRRHATRHHG